MEVDEEESCQMMVDENEEKSSSSSSSTSIQSPSTSTELFPIFKKKFKPKTSPLNAIADAIQKSTRPRKKRSLLGKKETPGLTQLVIDAGQKEIGPRMCGDCGLLYTPGDLEDEEEHRKAHARLENFHTITIWKEPKIVGNFADGSYIVVVKTQGCHKNILNRLKNFLEWVDSELSVYSDTELSQSNQLLFLYLYPTKRKNTVRILGYASMELLHSTNIVAHRITESEDSVLVSGIPLLAGITRLWTDKIFRKKKIATRLVDAIRVNNGILGCVIPKDKLGILEPSEDGRIFMCKYSEGLSYSYTYA